MKKTNIILLLLSAVILLFAAGCNGDDDTNCTHGNNKDTCPACNPVYDCNDCRDIPGGCEECKPHDHHNDSDYCADVCMPAVQIPVPSTPEGLDNEGKHIDLVFPVGLKGDANAARRNVIINRFTGAAAFFDEYGKEAEIESFKENLNVLLNSGFKIFIKETNDLADSINVNSEFQFTAGTEWLEWMGMGEDSDEMIANGIASVLLEIIFYGEHLPPTAQ